MALVLAGVAISTPQPALYTVTGNVAAASRTPPTVPRRMFISGHSLTAPPFPDYVATLAEASGAPLRWNMQHLYGSSLKDRTRGSAGVGSDYRAGIDRHGKPADVLAALAGVQEFGPYDTLILTEQHTLLQNIIWNDTVGHTADFVRHFKLSNPAGRAFLFSSWLGINDLNDPTAWLNYESVAAPAWNCTAAAVSRRLASEGWGQGIELIPAAEGIAYLVKQALAGRLDGITQATPHHTLETIFLDDVHLTPAGNYYVALLTLAWLHGDLPPRSWTPAIGSAAAASLYDTARAFVASRPAGQMQSRESCGRYLSGPYLRTYLAYVRGIRSKQVGWARAHAGWVRSWITWRWALREGSEHDPFGRAVGQKRALALPVLLSQGDR